MEFGKFVGRFLFLLYSLCISSCMVDPGNPHSSGGFSSLPLTVNFTVDGVAAVQASKAQGVAESAVQDVNLYILNELGHVISYGHYRQGSGIRASIYDGMDYSVYAIANAGVPLPARDVEQILSFIFRPSPDNMPPGAGGTVLMAGMLPLQRLAAGASLTVPLERCVAKVLLKCDFSTLNSDVKIEVSGIRLRNVPRSVAIFAQSRALSVEDVTDGVEVLSPGETALRNGVPFYLFENMQGNLQPGNNVQSGKVWPQGSLNSQICSYLEMKASYSSPRKVGEILYRFYLGKDMVSNYDVERNMQYNVTVSFRGDGAVDENSWRVDNSGIRDAVPPEISFAETGRVMYDLEEALLPFSKIYPPDAQVVSSSSNGSVVQVLESDASGVKVKAISPGEATIVASVGGKSASCRIVVEKLRIVPVQDRIDLYNHFYSDISCSILPAHASSLGLKFTSSSTSLAVGYGGVPGRVIPQYPASANLPVTGRVTVSIEGRDDVSAGISVTVNPMLQMKNSISANANMGSTATVKGLGLSTSPHAELEFSWVPSDGISIYGDPGKNIVVSAPHNNVTFPLPNGANGKYRLKCSVVGDDGYGTDEFSHTDAVRYCDISVYETIYLVGVSKTMNREKTGTDPDRWKYENEVVAKWLAHPSSLMFPNGELDLDLGFVYKGVEYSDSHTEFLEEFSFEFEKGDYIQYALDAGYTVYNGTAPPYYMEYFALEPAVSPYVQGSLVERRPFLYIYSRNFASGFSTSASPGWSRIFEYVYPK